MGLDFLSRSEVLSFFPLSVGPDLGEWSLPRFEEIDASSDLVSGGLRESFMLTASGFSVVTI